MATHGRNENVSYVCRHIVICRLFRNDLQAFSDTKIPGTGHHIWSFIRSGYWNFNGIRLIFLVANSLRIGIELALRKLDSGNCRWNNHQSGR